MEDKGWTVVKGRQRNNNVKKIGPVTVPEQKTANSFQDWKQVTIEKKSAPIVTHKQQPPQTYTHYVDNKLKKIEQETDVITLDLVQHSLGEKIKSARQALNMTRKELGLKVNINENMIADIENGAANYDPVLCTKIKKCLKI